MSQPMFSLVLKDFLSAVLKHLDSNIRFPLREDFAHVKAEFCGLAHIPHVVEAIDGNHVALVLLLGTEQVSRNRKSFHSINVQVVCLADLYIFQGSVHDAFIMWNCAIPQLTTTTVPREGLAGWGFSLLKSCLVVDTSEKPTTPGEDCFSEALGRTCWVVELDFGLMKVRFCSIDKTGGALLYSPSKVCKIIVARCMLQNLALRRNIPSIPDEGQLAVPQGEPPEISSENDSFEDEGGDIHADLINQYFT
ncbi:putative nuclease HARBI1 [Pleurodeles waltl]|uniref:putative nuclease HARBI1 n=1 Tax=Pleurodeles waltl TaxID=8319 RepID=UPI0037095037